MSDVIKLAIEAMRVKTATDQLEMLKIYVDNADATRETRELKTVSKCIDQVLTVLKHEPQGDSK